MLEVKPEGDGYRVTMDDDYDEICCDISMVINTFYTTLREESGDAAAGAFQALIVKCACDPQSAFWCDLEAETFKAKRSVAAMGEGGMLQ